MFKEVGATGASDGPDTQLRSAQSAVESFNTMYHQLILVTSIAPPMVSDSSAGMGKARRDTAVPYSDTPLPGLGYHIMPQLLIIATPAAPVQ